MTSPSDRGGTADGAIAEADEIAKPRRQRMIRIAITAAACRAVRLTLPQDAPLAGGAMSNSSSASRRAVLDRLTASGGEESRNDVILRLAADMHLLTRPSSLLRRGSSYGTAAVPFMMRHPIRR